MRRLVINHANGRIPRPLTILLGTVLLVCLAFMMEIYSKLQAENFTLQAQLEIRKSATNPFINIRKKNDATDSTLTAEIAEAQSHIQTPWMTMLQDIEKAHQANLYWMQLTPDTKRKSIRMIVLAPNRKQGWALVERLKQQTGLNNVKLKSSETTDVNGVGMTTLHVEAGWKY